MWAVVADVDQWCYDVLLALEVAVELVVAFVVELAVAVVNGVHHDVLHVYDV